MRIFLSREKRKLLDLYRNNSFFSELSDRNLLQLLEISKEVTFEPGEYIIHEADEANDFYIIIDGELDVLKFDTLKNRSHQISKLSAGETFGEMSWLNNAPRSASVVARTPTRLRRISYKDAQILVDKEAGFYRIFRQIAKNLSQRLNLTDDFAIKALERELHENKIRVSLGNFMLIIITALCVYAYSLNIMISVTKNESTSTYLTTVFVSVLLIFFFMIKKTSKLPLKKFGFTLERSRIAIIEAVIFTIPIMVFTVFAKWVAINYIPEFSHHHLFDPYLTLHNTSPQYLFRTWLISVTLYCLIGVSFQEILTRGALQAPLQEFLTGKHKTLIAIVASNLIFSTMHIYLSIQLSFIVLLAGFYFGWLFNRHKNLIGVYVAHALIGIWAIFIVGIINV